jgi:quinone-modifying oxidoreductase subunit QmoC
MAEETVDNNQADAADESAEAATDESAEATEESAVATKETEAVATEEAPAEAETVPAEAKTEAIMPDIKFVKDVINSGGSDLKKCYQCATCSVVCNVSPDDHPFPRKEMLYAQWGLKDKLMGSPDIWLCQQCSDCVAQCPRDAKPGKVMQAIAKMTISNYSIPGIAKAAGNMGGTILLAIIPTVIILIALAAQDSFSNIPRGDDGEIVYSEFMATSTAIDPLFSAFFILSGLVFFIGARKYWRDMSSNHAASGGDKPGSFMSNIGPTISEFLTHKRFRECDETEDRANAHLLVFYGFVGLFLTTAWAVVYFYIVGWHSPFAFTNPIKWLGNISAAAGIVGMTMIIIYRFNHAERVGIGSYFDWSLIVTIYIILLTGIGAEILRLADLGSVAYPVYAIHLISVLFLFIYMPFSKMAHMVYRMIALVFARAIGRDTGVA